MFELEDLEPLLVWIDGLLPSLDRVVEPVIAATRLPRPDGPPVLLLHTTAMCGTLEEAERVLAPLAECPIAGRAISHERGPTTIEAENEAQALQNPEGHRYAVDCTWTDAKARGLAPSLREVWSELPIEHSFAIWYGWSRADPLPDMAFSIEGRRLPRHLRDLVGPRRRRAPPRRDPPPTRSMATPSGVVCIGDTDFTHRPDRFLDRRGFAELERIRAARSRWAVLLLPDRRGRRAQRRTRPPLVHDGLAGDRASAVAGEEGDRGGDILGSERSVDRLPGAHVIEHLRGRVGIAAGVGVSPGATQLTVIPSRPRAARACARSRPAWPCWPRTPADRGRAVPTPCPRR